MLRFNALRFLTLNCSKRSYARATTQITLEYEVLLVSCTVWCSVNSSFRYLNRTSYRYICGLIASIEYILEQAGTMPEIPKVNRPKITPWIMHYAVLVIRRAAQEQLTACNMHIENIGHEIVTL